MSLNSGPLHRIVLLLLCFALPGCAHSQARYAATRAGDLQVGVGYSTANADYEYVHNRIAGFYFYTDFDFRENFGIEANFRQLNDPNSAVYERTYTAGVRYIRHYNARKLGINPYIKLMPGRGTLNFPAYANLTYNIVAGAGGVDFWPAPRFNVRAEFEYQDWISAPGAGLAINPSMFSIGVAYHFSAGKPTKGRN